MLAAPHSPTSSRGNLNGGVLSATLHEEQPDVSLDSDNFWGLAARFRNAEIEQRYQAEGLTAKLRSDVHMHVHGLFPGLFLAYRHWQSVSWFGLATMLSLSMITAPVFLYMCLYERSFYRRFRAPIIIYINLHSISMFLFLAQDEPVTSTTLSLLGLIVLKSPVTVGVYFSMNGNLSLHHNFVLQILATPLFLLWSSMFCKRLTCCCADMRPVLDELGTIINVLVVVLSNTGVGKDKFSCGLTVSSIVLFLGVLAPSALAYNLDVFRRKAFASRNYPAQLSIDFERSISDTQAAAWYLVAVIQTGWIVFILLFFKK